MMIQLNPYQRKRSLSCPLSFVALPPPLQACDLLFASEKDASSIEFRLAAILEKTPVEPGNSFELLITSPFNNITEPETGVFEFYNSRRFVCASGAASGQFRKFAREHFETTLTLRYPADSIAPFILMGWR